VVTAEVKVALGSVAQPQHRIHSLWWEGEGASPGSPGSVLEGANAAQHKPPTQTHNLCKGCRTANAH
jgi:hypothetical protein